MYWCIINHIHLGLCSQQDYKYHQTNIKCCCRNQELLTLKERSPGSSISRLFSHFYFLWKLLPQQPWASGDKQDIFWPTLITVNLLAIFLTFSPGYASSESASSTVSPCVSETEQQEMDLVCLKETTNLVSPGFPFWTALGEEGPLSKLLRSWSARAPLKLRE